MALQAEFRNRAIRSELYELRSELTALKNAEERRLVNDLNPSRTSNADTNTPSILPQNLSNIPGLR